MDEYSCYLPQPTTYSAHSQAQSAGWNCSSSFSLTYQTFFLRYPIIAKASSNWMVLFAIGSYLNNCELEIASIARQTRRVEQSSDRQVVLNCHCEDHFVFFNKSTICLRISNIVINLVYIHCKPPCFFFSFWNLIYSEPLKSAKLNKLFGLGFIEICFTPTEAFSSSFADSWRRQLTAGRDSSLAQLNH